MEVVPDVRCSSARVQRTDRGPAMARSVCCAVEGFLCLSMSCHSTIVVIYLKQALLYVWTKQVDLSSRASTSVKPRPLALLPADGGTIVRVELHVVLWTKAEPDLETVRNAAKKHGSCISHLARAPASNRLDLDNFWRLTRH